ncbi:PAS domain-containing sensor histidine kinase [Aquabacterium sp. A7-Y]|uniref:sensor histidine kinase n=1 Tax=Aquabacterium sp. A7-Y TaxID=1349605 RepID=UPI00223CDB45|nr:PAS domain-containing sensor histidine kinase [Aquabacterium sp. A7-Y]MCW7536689.1 PAS domain-containing sensor histidine kinase [Aquabacterium sp. A7-Y]
MSGSDAGQLPDAQVLFEDAACGLMVTSRDGTFRKVNRTFCRWVGRDTKELVGQRKLQELLTMGGRIFHQTHWAPLLQIQGSVSEVKLDVLHRDGRTIPMVINAVRREHGGVIFHEVAAFVAEDRHQYERELLRERQRAEQLLAKEQQAQEALALTQQRLRLALDSAQLFLWDIDPAGPAARYEDKVALLLGYDQARAITREEYVARIHPEDVAGEAHAYLAAQSVLSGRYAAMYRLRGVDGIERTVSGAGQGFFDGAGRLVQFVGILHDVTELSRERAAAEDRALFSEQMIGIVSHDLRNPLSVIKLSAGLLNRMQPSADQAAVIARINTATSHASRLIGDLLDFTQVRLGRGLSVAVKPTQLHPVVSNSLEQLALAFPQRQLEHRRVGSGECMADEDRLVQIVNNLVSNAVSYGAPDRPIVVISSIENETFSIAVHNEGPPVPPSLLPQLFEPMTRGDKPSAQQRSVGLGLFIVRQIVRAHGGEVSVTSSAETGTRFFARFPRLQENGCR